MKKLICFAALLISTVAAAEELTVDISRISPMVMKEGKEYTGFSLDLWKAVAKELDVPYTYREVLFPAIFEGLDAGTAQVAIAGISVTSAREEAIDFTHPVLNSGLRIAVPTPEDQGALALLRTLLSGPMMETMVYFLGFIFLCGHVMWLAERGCDAINDKYFPGIMEAFWCVLTTMTTVGYGDIAPRRWPGRFAAMLIMMTGITFFGFVVAQLSAELTGRRISDVVTYHDLRGRKVATVRGTTSAAFLEKINADVVLTDTAEQMQDKLLAGRVQAIVFDAPSILYFVQQEHDSVSVAGELFAEQYYAFALAPGSPLREPINRALLKLHEDGTYETLYRRWFGG